MPKYLNYSKVLNQSKQKVKPGETQSTNKNRFLKIYRCSKMSIITKTPTITIIQKITGANHEAEGHIQAKTLVDYSDHKLTMVEVNAI